MNTAPGDKLVFNCSGRFIRANSYIIGIGEEMGSLNIGEGYDGGPYPESSNDIKDYRPFTDEEKIELADYMISLWERFKTEKYSSHY